MTERFADMEKKAAKASLEERLKPFPGLYTKVETLVGILENAGGDIEKASEAERRIIEALREAGKEALEGWARRQQEKKETEYNAKAGVNRKEKKTSSGTPGSEKSE